MVPRPLEFGSPPEAELSLNLSRSCSSLDVAFAATGASVTPAGRAGDPLLSWSSGLAPSASGNRCRAAAALVKGTGWLVRATLREGRRPLTEAEEKEEDEGPAGKAEWERLPMGLRKGMATVSQLRDGWKKQGCQRPRCKKGADTTASLTPESRCRPVAGGRRGQESFELTYAHAPKQGGEANHYGRDAPSHDFSASASPLVL